MLIFQGWTSSMGYMNAANNLILRASIEAKQVGKIQPYLQMLGWDKNVCFVATKNLNCFV
jgi:hypothetical protein